MVAARQSADLVRWVQETLGAVFRNVTPRSQSGNLLSLPFGPFTTGACVAARPNPAFRVSDPRFSSPLG